MATRIVITLTEAERREVVKAFRSLRDKRKAQGTGKHPIAQPDDRVAAEWFLAAALVQGARLLDDEGPG